MDERRSIGRQKSASSQNIFSTVSALKSTASASFRHKPRKLVRSPEAGVCDIPTSVVATIAASVTNVMGGGFTSPPSVLIQSKNKPTDGQKKQLVSRLLATNCKSNSSGSSEGEVHLPTDPTTSELNSFVSSFHPSTLTTLEKLSSVVVESPDDPPEFEYHTFSADSSNSQEGSSDIISDPSSFSFSFKDTAPVSMGSELSAGLKVNWHRNPSTDSDNSNRLENLLFRAPEDPRNSASQHYPTTDMPPASKSLDNDPELKYYQYTLTSPNNPFLPEIIARTYRSEDTDGETVRAWDDSDPRDRGKLSPTQSLFAISRSSSAEKSDNERNHADVISGLGFEGGGPGIGGGGERPGTSDVGDGGSGGSAGCQVKNKGISPDGTSSVCEPCSPGKHKRKLFTLSSPAKESKHQQQQHHQRKEKPSSQFSSTGTVVRNFNPFISSSKQETAQQSNLNAKREEFLRATMKICLVVSPPTNKLQLKSKSLTHLDGLDSIVTCHGANIGTKSRPSEQLETSFPQTLSKPSVVATYSHPPTGATSTTHHQYQTTHQPPQSPVQQTYSLIQGGHQHQTPPPHHSSISSSTSTVCNKICCLGGGSSGGGSGAISKTTILSIGALSPGSGIYSNPSSLTGPLTTSNAGQQNNVMATTQGSSGAPVTVTAASTTSVPKKKSSFMQRKKPLLSRSEISSSEFFSVSFCMDNGCQEEEFIPVIKGVTLIEALGNTLRRRNLSFSKIFITDNNLPNFWESGSPPYTSSFDENTDIESLAGRNLLITDRDGKKPLQKAASFGSRTRPPRLLSSASTEETTESEQRTIPGKQLKQRWSGLFGVKNPHQNQLCELLNGYAKNGVPQKSTPFSFDHPDLDVALVYLDQMHSSWKDFIPCDNMSDNDTKIQTAIWELVTTEVYYIHALQTVTDLFLACLEAIQEENLLTDVDQHKLFSNVRDICEANLKFWTFYLFPMVAHSVANHVPLCIDFFRQGFVTFATTFAPYKKYCAEQSTCQFYCKELNQNNSLFTAYLAWCESQKMCNRLRLADILVRPMQRLTKYNLLLNAIRRHVIDEDDADAIDEMIHSVENFVCSVNNHLTTRQENERLKGVMARIECYEVVDTKDENLERLVKQHSAMFDLCAPMKGCPSNQVRHLFMEGDHKFKDNLGKADVHCFLLTDILLICKTIAKKGLGALKVIRQPYLTDRLVVHHHGNTLNCIYLNEFQVATTAFILQCSEAKNWYESLKRAKHIYTRLKQNTSNNWETYRYPSGGISGGTVDSLGVKKSPINSSICSHVTSANNSHSGSVEWNDSRNISVDFEKTNSLSSDEGSGVMSTNAGQVGKMKTLATSPHKHKMITSSNTLSVQPINHLGQSLPNLHLHHNQTNNTLLVPGSTGNQSSNLLSPSHRGISYPPPSPTRATLRRGMAFSSSIKNPPLVKTRNITSQSSINWHQIPATPTPTSPQSQLQQSSSSSTSQNVPAPPTTPSAEQLPLTPSSDRAAQFANQGGSENTSLNVSSTETDV